MLLFHCTKDAIEALTATHQENALLGGQCPCRQRARSHGAGSCTR